jgi:imidazolonepropionase-like amidohydrolase
MLSVGRLMRVLKWERVNMLSLYILSLSLLKELKYVNNGELDVVEAIKYLTIIPAKILRLNNVIGSLETDKDADFNVFNLNEGEDYNAILNKERPDFVYIKARRVVKNGKLNIRQ